MCLTLPYALNLTLDPDSADQIERVYSRLAMLGIPDRDLITQYGPCVTLLVIGDRLSAKTVARTLELRLSTLEVVAAAFMEPCIIFGTPPTLSLRVAPTEPLLSLHNTMFSEFAEDEVHLHYRPAYWQPHLKLCNIRGDHAAADRLAATVAAEWRTVSGLLGGLEVIQYPPTQSVWQARLQRPRPSPED